MRKLFFILLILIPTVVFALEKDYQIKWCNEMGGQSEVVLDDKSRVDCLLDKYAIEVEYAYKWKESIGQALFYAIKTDRLPGILLIMDNTAGSTKNLERLKLVASHTWIKVWVVYPNFLDGIKER